jgi:putative RNA 2'-phosphotransferase
MSISNKRLIKISKYLSYHLRHRPDLLGLEIALGGWVEVDQLLTAAQQNNFPLSLAELKTVVEQNDKQRFSFDSTGKLIRANQGHSVAVNLELQSRTPPSILYHGTDSKALESIQQQGLLKMNRHHVHLSSDYSTAIKVEQRRGSPIVLKIDAEAMINAGFKFYCSDNEVWLVDSIPPKFIAQFKR